jgi:hypothetical protein
VLSALFVRRNSFIVLTVLFWVVTTCSLVGGYQRLGGRYHAKAVPWLRRLVTAFSPRRPGLVHTGYVVCRVALGQVSLRVLQFPLSVSLHRDSPYSYITWRMNNRPVQRHSLIPSTRITTRYHPVLGLTLKIMVDGTVLL